MKYKLLKFTSIITIIFFLTACSTSDDQKKTDYSESNSTVQENDKASNNDKAIAMTIAENTLKDHYNIDNFKVKYDIKVNRLPDDENAETGEILKQLYNARGTFSYNDTLYSFTEVYSLKSEDNFSLVYFSTKLNEDLTIDVPLKSEQ